jgi:drug/metabolite transporter (DMT)-like permease
MTAVRDPGARDRSEPIAAGSARILRARPAGANYRLGAVYAFATATLLALQEPFSALAAHKLDSADFIAFTQVSLLASIPLLIARTEARRDFAALITDWRAWPKFAVLLGVGLCGLELYDLGLSSAHPIITAAVLNLSPFWAAIVAFAVSRKPLPRSPSLFFCCFSLAFLGAMLIAWSQINLDPTRLLSDVIRSALQSHWIYALPMPIMFALSGTLVYVWFQDYDESAAIGVNFLVSGVVLIPAAIVHAHFRAASISGENVPAILLLLIGTLASSAAGRVFYQAALSATRNDNGFVTMFFLIIPALSALVSWPLSFWIRDLGFRPNSIFLAGLALVTAPLLLFVSSFLRVGVRKRTRAGAA